MEVAKICHLPTMFYMDLSVSSMLGPFCAFYHIASEVGKLKVSQIATRICVFGLLWPFFQTWGHGEAEKPGDTQQKAYSGVVVSINHLFWGIYIYTHPLVMYDKIAIDNTPQKLHLLGSTTGDPSVRKMQRTTVCAMVKTQCVYLYIYIHIHIYIYILYIYYIYTYVLVSFISSILYCASKHNRYMNLKVTWWHRKPAMFSHLFWPWHICCLRCQSRCRKSVFCHRPSGLGTSRRTCRLGMFWVCRWMLLLERCFALCQYPIIQYHPISISIIG